MEPVKLEDFKKLDLRVAQIIEAHAHPNAEKLVVLKIQVGDVQKQIVAGIKMHYALDDLKGKKIVVVNNLEPVQLRGEVSEGMLLAASHEGFLTLLTPEKDIVSGAVVK